MAYCTPWCICPSSISKDQESTLQKMFQIPNSKVLNTRYYSPSTQYYCECDCCTVEVLGVGWFVWLAFIRSFLRLFLRSFFVCVCDSFVVSSRLFLVSTEGPYVAERRQTAGPLTVRCVRFGHATLLCFMMTASNRRHSDRTGNSRGGGSRHSFILCLPAHKRAHSTPSLPIYFLLPMSHCFIATQHTTRRDTTRPSNERTNERTNRTASE